MLCNGKETIDGSKTAGNNSYPQFEKALLAMETLVDLDVFLAKIGEVNIYGKGCLVQLLN